MTKEQITNLQIPVGNLDDETIVTIESGIEWINSNTTLHIDLDNPPEKLPSNVRLFLAKYVDIMSIRPGVTSESISGLSQSFDTTDRYTLIRQYASSLLGEYMVSDLKFVPAVRGWDSHGG